jgi:hypothetical protein
MRFGCALLGVGITLGTFGILQIGASWAQVSDQKQGSADQAVGTGSGPGTGSVTGTGTGSGTGSGTGTGSTSIHSLTQLDSKSADVDLDEWYRKIIATTKQQVFHDEENPVAINQVCFATLTFTRAGEITVNFVPRQVSGANKSLVLNVAFVEKLKRYGVALNSEVMNTDNSELEKTVAKAFKGLQKSELVRFPDGAKEDVYQFEAFFISL